MAVPAVVAFDTLQSRSRTAVVSSRGAHCAAEFFYTPPASRGMQELTDSLEAAFEEHGYGLGEVSVNRNRVRIAVRDPEASAGELRGIVHDAVDADDVLGLDVTTESASGGDEVVTVVSFRYRG